MCLQPFTMWRLICGCCFFSNSARSPAWARSSRPKIIKSGIFSSLSLSHNGLGGLAAPRWGGGFVILAFLVCFEIAADHAAMANGDVFVRDQSMIEGVRLQEFAGILH